MLEIRDHTLLQRLYPRCQSSQGSFFTVLPQVVMCDLQSKKANYF